MSAKERRRKSAIARKRAQKGAKKKAEKSTTERNRAPKGTHQKKAKARKNTQKSVKGRKRAQKSAEERKSCLTTRCETTRFGDSPNTGRPLASCLCIWSPISISMSDSSPPTPWNEKCPSQSGNAIGPRHPNKRSSKMRSLDAKNLESILHPRGDKPGRFCNPGWFW